MLFIGTRGKGARGTTLGPKHGRGRARTAAEMWLGRVSAALPGRRAPGRLLRAVSSVPYQLDLLNFRVDLPVLTESPPKVNGYLVGL